MGGSSDRGFPRVVGNCACALCMGSSFWEVAQSVGTPAQDSGATGAQQPASSAADSASSSPGLRGVRTTSLFRAVNPELFIRPASALHSPASVLYYTRHIRAAVRLRFSGVSCWTLCACARPRRRVRVYPWHERGVFKVNPLVVFGLLSHLWCSRSKMTGLQTTAYKSVIMLYYH